MSEWHTITPAANTDAHLPDALCVSSGCYDMWSTGGLPDYGKVMHNKFVATDEHVNSWIKRMPAFPQNYRIAHGHCSRTRTRSGARHGRLAKMRR